MDEIPSPLAGYYAHLRLAMQASGITVQQLATLAKVKPTTLRSQIQNESTPLPEQVFAYERAMKLRPGSLSKHLGYAPVGAGPPAPSVSEVIMSAKEIPMHDRVVLVEVYRALRSLHSPKASKSSSSS